MDYTASPAHNAGITENLVPFTGFSPAASFDDGQYEELFSCLQCNDTGYVDRDWYGAGPRRECCPFCAEGELRASQEATR